MITLFSGYKKDMETAIALVSSCHAHDPEVAIRESLALKISTPEKKES